MRKISLGLGFAALVASQAFFLTPTVSAETVRGVTATTAKAAVPTIAGNRTQIATRLSVHDPLPAGTDPDIVDSGPVSLVTPQGGDNELNFVTGAFGPYGSTGAGADFNPYTGTGSVLYVYTFADAVEGQGTVTDDPSPPAQVAVLEPGDEVILATAARIEADAVADAAQGQLDEDAALTVGRHPADRPLTLEIDRVNIAGVITGRPLGPGREHAGSRQHPADIQFRLIVTHACAPPCRLFR